MARIARFFLPANSMKRLTVNSQLKTENRDPETPREVQAESDPEKLLTSANNASGPARAAWLAFLALLTYLLVTLAGVTDKDLLLNSPVTLPIANVNIPLFSFFLAAPFLLVLVHLSLLLQHVMLAQQYRHFSAAVAAGEEGPARDHPDRQLVHNYVFAQMLAGAKPPWLLHTLMRLMIFVTLSLLPILVLLYFQIKFLPFHDVATTHAHRFAILLDLALLLVVRPFIAMPNLRPRGGKLRFGNQNWTWELSYWSLGAAVCMIMFVMSFSLLVATIPQACDWPINEEPEAAEKLPEDCFSLDRKAASWRAMLTGPGGHSGDVFALIMWLFEGEWFHRNLELEEASLIREGPSLDTIARYQLAGKTEQDANVDLTRGLNLRKRDLRNASLRLARLHNADLSGAKLQGAHLEDAQLQGADMDRARIWKTAAPELSGLEQAIPMEQPDITRLDLLERRDLEGLIDRFEDETLQNELRMRLKPLLKTNEAQNWKSTEHYQAWIRFSSKQPRLAPDALAEFLGDLACGDITDGYIMKGISKRIIRKREDYGALVAKRLVDQKEACAAIKYLDDATLANLRDLVAPE